MVALHMRRSAIERAVVLRSIRFLITTRCNSLEHFARMQAPSLLKSHQLPNGSYPSFGDHSLPCADSALNIPSLPLTYLYVQGEQKTAQCSKRTRPNALRLSSPGQQVELLILAWW